MALYLGILAFIGLGATIGSGYVLYSDNSLLNDITTIDYNNIKFDTSCDSKSITTSFDNINASIKFSRFINGFILAISVLLLLFCVIGIIYIVNQQGKEQTVSQLKTSFEKSQSIFTSKVLYFILGIIVLVALIINLILYTVALVSIRNITEECIPTGNQRQAFDDARSSLTYQVFINAILSVFLLIGLIVFGIFANLSGSLENLKTNIQGVKKDIQSQAQTIFKKPTGPANEVELTDMKPQLNDIKP
jgi:flagellar biosynthesis protein FlhB